MAIKDVLDRTQATPRKGPSCAVCAALETLPDGEGKALAALLADPTWRYQALADELLTEGIDLPAGSLSRHARGRCAARTKLR